ncbi:hypothetical protein DFH07DRAFT_808035 [Mycena maculata]|uniref:Uncharacterized protein n=1 Tax=Mycena maculata TaxID=230809 RepID=A0AAD7NNA2_9AGAR|nr:hypothetical protein DFH07DRAFT_808035 [Mycena maculata]
MPKLLRTLRKSNRGNFPDISVDGLSLNMTEQHRLVYQLTFTPTSTLAKSTHHGPNGRLLERLHRRPPRPRSLLRLPLHPSSLPPNGRFRSSPLLGRRQNRAGDGSPLLHLRHRLPELARQRFPPVARTHDSRSSPDSHGPREWHRSRTRPHRTRRRGCRVRGYHSTPFCSRRAHHDTQGRGLGQQFLDRRLLLPHTRYRVGEEAPAREHRRHAAVRPPRARGPLRRAPATWLRRLAGQAKASLAIGRGGDGCTSCARSPG